MLYKYGKTKPSLEMERKYAPYNRTDYTRWNYVWVIFTHFFAIPRVALGYTIIVVGMVVGRILTIGHDRREKLGPKRLAIINLVISSFTRCVTLCYGNIWQTVTQRPVDYSKWLGPDY